MQNRRDYSSRHKIGTFDFVDNNGTDIRPGESLGNYSRFNSETQPKTSFTSLNPSNNEYITSRLYDNNYISPSGSLKKIVTISRKESPIHSPSNRFQNWSGNENATTINDIFYKGTSSRESQQEPLFKTTMITQVNPPKADARASPYTDPQFDQSFIKFSVKQPQQKNNSIYEPNKNLKSELYKQPNMQNSYSTKQSQNTQSPNYTFSMHPNQAADRQFVISNYKPASNQQPYLKRIIDTSKSLNENPPYNSNSNNVYYKIGEQYYSNDGNDNMFSNEKSYINQTKASSFNNNSNFVINNKYKMGDVQNYDEVSENNIRYSSIGNRNDYKSSKNLSKEAEVDVLTKLLVENMRMSAEPDFYGMCVKCSRSIMGATNGCTVLNQTYHTNCFLCKSCAVSLANSYFFCLDGECFCEDCYMKTLEKCSVCRGPIIDRLLQTMGKYFHVSCFRCSQCGQSLENDPFTVDDNNNILCLQDYQRRHGMRCEGCGMQITVVPGGHEVSSVLFNKLHYHTQCFRCQECQTPLSLRSNGKGCFPLESSNLCHKCHKLHNKIYTDL